MKTDNSKYWWWRKFLAAKTDSFPHDFFKEIEAIAFYYELGRRNFPLEKYPDFTKLNSGEFGIAYERFKKFARWKPPAALDFGNQPYEHDGFIIFTHTSWNLRASKNSLQESFWDHIVSARRERGIKIEDGHNANNAARTAGGHQPWSWLEMIDRPKGLNDNDRSKKSVAKTKMREIKNDFIKLWKEIKDHRSRTEHYYQQNPQACKMDRARMIWGKCVESIFK